MTITTTRRLQNGDFGRNFVYFPLIFSLFSAYGTPSDVFKPICLWNSLISAYFHLFSVYFLPIMVPHPCYKLKHGTHLLFFCPHVYGFCLFSTHFPPISRLTFCPYSAGPVLPGSCTSTMSNWHKISEHVSFHVNTKFAAQNHPTDSPSKYQ